MAEKIISLANLSLYNNKVKEKYQLKNDNSLNTSDKTLVGAINENKTQINNLMSNLNGYSFVNTQSENPKELYLQELENPLPPIITSNDFGKLLCVNNNGTGFEYVPKPVDGSDYTEILTTTNIVGGILTLTRDKFQKTTMVDLTEIKLPTTTEFTQIHLFFSTNADLSLVLPNVRWQSTPNIKANKYYELIFTYIDTWTGGIVEYV